MSVRARIAGVTALLILLAALYVFQKFNYLGWMMGIVGQDGSVVHPYAYFIFNKTVRFILNDLCCLGCIYLLFQQQKYLKVAWLVFLFELVILLPLYFTLKLSLEGDDEISSPLLSQLHRLIVNPTFMILLVIAFYYQRFQQPNK